MTIYYFLNVLYSLSFKSKGYIRMSSHLCLSYYGLQYRKGPLRRVLITSR